MDFDVKYDTIRYDRVY